MDIDIRPSKVDLNKKNTAYSTFTTTQFPLIEFLIKISYWFIITLLTVQNQSDSVQTCLNNQSLTKELKHDPIRVRNTLFRKAFLIFDLENY